MRYSSRVRFLLGCLEKRCFSTAPKRKDVVEINSRVYQADDYTNVTPRILTYLNRNLHLQKKHPLSLVRASIVEYFYKNYVNVKGSPLFSVHDHLNPVVSVEQNFDSLLIPLGHPSRAKGDCYYINRNLLLRAHTTAHQLELIKSGLDNFIMIGDVYRRDAIDSTHFPVFHQMDGVRSQTRDQLFPDQPTLTILEPGYKIPAFELEKWHPDIEKRAMQEPCLDGGRQPCHTLEAVKVVEHQLQNALVGMVKHLFGENIEFRWVRAYFPFTQPSWELEVWYDEAWLEVLGCGIVRHEIMERAGAPNCIAYAFGLGLERIAMALYNIPDIRLFWSLDSGFLTQFDCEPGRRIKYRPVSIYPQCTNDLSFWLPDGQTQDTFSTNDFLDLVRDVGGDIVEQVNLKDTFIHPKTGKTSLCYSIIYRHMERTLTKEEVNRVHGEIEKQATGTLHVTIR